MYLLALVLKQLRNIPNISLNILLDVFLSPFPRVSSTFRWQAGHKGLKEEQGHFNRPAIASGWLVGASTLPLPTYFANIKTQFRWPSSVN